MDITYALNWIITSSKDPKQTSLMIKGLVMLFGSYLLNTISVACGIGLTCVGIDQEMINQFADIMEILVFAIMLLIGSVATLAGLLRKVKFGRWSSLK